VRAVSPARCSFVSSVSMSRKPRGFWIGLLLAAGTTLAVVLLIQTANNYRYVSDTLIRQEARRIAEEAVRTVERAVRLARPQDAAEFASLIDDVRSERPNHIAWILRRQETGAGADRRMALTHAADGRAVLLGVFPCRCGPRDVTATQENWRDRPVPTSLEVALYRDGLSAPFVRLRRDALVSTAAAVTLLLSLLLIARRFRGYVRGKLLESQMELARDVQRNLLPSGDAPAGLDVAAECVPTARVGGDFYDIVSLPNGRSAFLVGDVSGHGVSAGLLTALIHGAMSGPPWGVSDDESDRAAALNHLLVTKSSAERFASLFWCAFDPASATLRYINAGHPPPIWLRNVAGGVATMSRLTEGGPLLGLLPAASYRVESIQARAGDVLVLFSDGLVDLTNAADEFFGEDRLMSAIAKVADQPARVIVDTILSAARAFAAGRPNDDDETLLVVRLPARSTP
jgi:Stage II sporulation protein E (SpoIIE)